MTGCGVIDENTCSQIFEGNVDSTLTTNAQNFSYRLKMSESADLTTCELVSRHTGHKPNNALEWYEALGRLISPWRMRRDV